MKTVFTTDKLIQLTEKFQSATNIVIVAHQSPDGDAVGSCLALQSYLRKKITKSITVCLPDPAPATFEWLKGADEMLDAQNHLAEIQEIISSSTLVFSLDHNQLSRAGAELERMIKEIDPFKVMIDHHLFPSEEYDITFSDTSSCATAQMIFDFIEANDDLALIDEEIGEMIYCGIMTDTGSFRFPSTTAHTHHVIAKLLEAGVKNEKVHEAIYDTNSISRLKMRASVTEKMELIEAHKTALLFLTKEDMHAYNYQEGDADGLVNVGLSIKGINKAIFLKESNDLVKISFRSKGENNPVNELASSYFNGGGHANAAGGRFEGSIEDAIKKIKSVLHEFDHKH